jgi:hypothetical protein
MLSLNSIKLSIRAIPLTKSFEFGRRDKIEEALAITKIRGQRTKGILATNST